MSDPFAQRSAALRPGTPLSLPSPCAPALYLQSLCSSHVCAAQRSAALWHYAFNSFAHRNVAQRCAALPSDALETIPPPFCNVATRCGALHCDILASVSLHYAALRKAAAVHSFYTSGTARHMKLYRDCDETAKAPHIIQNAKRTDAMEEGT
jgi:hypothetical protein